jgi:hypothetical protein
MGYVSALPEARSTKSKKQVGITKEICMHKRLFGVMLTVALVGGLLSVASPVSAQDPPPASLLPDQDGTAVPAKFGNRLSDKFDGTDDVAHLTAVAPEATDRVQWRRCPTTATSPLDNAELATCNVTIGEDTEGVSVGPTGGFVSPDEAYDITWDIEVSGTVDIAVLACIGAGEDVEAGGNCVATLEEGIIVEDTDDADLTDTSTGEITSICTAGAATCTLAGNPDVSADDFTDFDHGDPVPDDGFTIRATTAPELNTPPLLHAELFAASANGEQDGVVIADVACVLLSAQATHATWECTFTGAQVPDNTTMSLLIDNNGGGVGNCAGPGVFCILDAHYTRSETRVASTAVLTFTGLLSAHGANCDDPVTEESNELGDTQAVDLCLTDQFGDAFAAGDATIALDTSVVTTSGFTACDGTAEDHDGDGYSEHCEGTTDADGVLRGEVTNPQDLAPPADRGDQVITGCSEGEPDPADADHGCADETVVASITKTWFSLPSVVHLVFADTGDPADPCLTGDSFKENKVGETDTLLACTFDNFGNPTTTDQEGGGRLQWTIDTTQGGDKTGVEFTSPPPSETDAATAQATAEIVATRRSGNFICVDLENVRGSGATADDDCVEKVVSPGGGGGRADSKVTIKDKFKGRVKSPSANCKNGRKVYLKKAKPGKDKTIGTDNAGPAGRWRISKPNAHGRFYAKVKRNAQCKAARSRTVKK